jgi:hypothetical protein
LEYNTDTGWRSLNTETGEWEKCIADPDEGYGDIAKIDIQDLREFYLYENLEGEAFDILDVGLWTKDGKYEGPVEEHRMGVAHE